MLISVVLSMLATAGAEEAPVGFVVHPHAEGYEALADTPANAEIANVFLWRMEDPEREIVAFDWAETWLERLYQSDRVAYPILDTSVFHSGAGWRQAKTAEAGENLVDFAGNERAISSLFSPIFRRSVLNYVQQLTEWVRENDTDHRIAGYLDGAEWFMPGTVDYSPLAFEAFRDWLEERYGHLDSLNATWGAEFGSWDDVEPPRGFLLGDDYIGLRTAGFAPLEVTWASPRFPIDGGERYRIAGTVLQEGVPEGLAALHLVCYDANGNRIAYYGDGQFIWVDAPDGVAQHRELITETPPNAVEAAFMMRLIGPGFAAFSELECAPWPYGESLLPPNREMDAWELINPGWRPESGPEIQSLSWDEARELPAGDETAAPGGGITLDDTTGAPTFHLAAPSGPIPYEHSALAWDDWITFCYVAMADWLNECAEFIKEQDPDRSVLSYLGSVFGMHCIPDFNMYWQRTDISLANSPAIDVNGIQMCIAGDDVTYATHLVDLARKYDKPIYATDLIDFPFGLYSGFEAIYRGTLAAVQHGMDGVFWYTWRESVGDFHHIDYSLEYSYSVMLTQEEQTRLIRDTKKAIAAFDGYDLNTPIALIMPVMAQSIAMPTGYGGDLINRGGWYHLLLDAGYIPDVYTPYELEHHGAACLDDYDLVIVPDTYMLSRKAYAALEAVAARGGHILADGAPPAVDLQGEPLGDTMPDVSPKALRNMVRDLPTIVEQAQADSWEGHLFGRAYWGPVRRWRVHGNTPPPFMQIEVDETTQRLRVELRRRVNERIGQYLGAEHFRLLTTDDRAHMAVWTNPEDPADVLLAFVHLGEGKAQQQRVQLPEGLTPDRVTAWIDFDREYEATIEDGVLTVPPFAHMCLVTLQ